MCAWYTGPNVTAALIYCLEARDLIRAAWEASKTGRRVKYIR